MERTDGREGPHAAKQEQREEVDPKVFRRANPRSAGCVPYSRRPRRRRTAAMDNGDLCTTACAFFLVLRTGETKRLEIRYEKSG